MVNSRRIAILVALLLSGCTGDQVTAEEGLAVQVSLSDLAKQQSALDGKHIFVKGFLCPDLWTVRLASTKRCLDGAGDGVIVDLRFEDERLKESLLSLGQVCFVLVKGILDTPDNAPTGDSPPELQFESGHLINTYIHVDSLQLLESSGSVDCSD